MSYGTHFTTKKQEATFARELKGLSRTQKMNTDLNKYKIMRKLNLREWHLVHEALKAQRDETVKIIQEAEKDPKKGRPLFTTAFIQREHNDLIEHLKSGVSKKALKLEEEFKNKNKSE